MGGQPSDLGKAVFLAVFEVLGDLLAQARERRWELLHSLPVRLLSILGCLMGSKGRTKDGPGNKRPGDT